MQPTRYVVVAALALVSLLAGCGSKGTCVSSMQCQLEVGESQCKNMSESQFHAEEKAAGEKRCAEVARQKGYVSKSPTLWALP